MNFDDFDCEQNLSEKDEKGDNKRTEDAEAESDKAVEEEQLKIKKQTCICCDVERSRKILHTLMQKFKKIDISKTSSSFNVTSSKNSKENDSVNSFSKESDDDDD